MVVPVLCLLSDGCTCVRNKKPLRQSRLLVHVDANSGAATNALAQTPRLRPLPRKESGSSPRNAGATAPLGSQNVCNKSQERFWCRWRCNWRCVPRRALGMLSLPATPFSPSHPVHPVMSVVDRGETAWLVKTTGWPACYRKTIGSSIVRQRRVCASGPGSQNSGKAGCTS